MPNRCDVNKLRSAVLDLAARIARVQVQMGCGFCGFCGWISWLKYVGITIAIPKKSKSSKPWKIWGKDLGQNNKQLQEISVGESCPLPLAVSSVPHVICIEELEKI